MTQSQSNHRHLVRIGGPHSRLPRFMESLFSWSLCLSCLSVSGYHYCISTYLKPAWSRLYHGLSSSRPKINNGSSSTSSRSSSSRSEDAENDDRSNKNCSSIISSSSSCVVWIPLTTHSQREMDSKTIMERYRQLCFYLSRVYNLHLCTTERMTTTTTTTTAIALLDDHASEKLMDILRKDTIGRRLASLIMMGKWGGRSYHRRLGRRLEPQRLLEEEGEEEGGIMGHNDDNVPMLVRFLEKNWTRLLEFPWVESSMTSKKMKKYDFEITLVVPCYGETNALLRRQVRKWYKHCKDPSRVEIVIVDAGGRSEDDHGHDHVSLFLGDGTSTDPCSWGCVRVIKYGRGGGRGPCLNYGAAASRGRILTFCHLDTTLPEEWDDKVRNELWRREGTAVVHANACAFGFGIDTSEEGLGGGPCPPGIRAVETTANIRTRLFALPYGDQALSLRKDMFDFLGGFPDQCLMEDYELVVLLRKRAAWLSKSSYSSSSSSLGQQEVLKIVPGKPALCSPRRWQKFGVLYVTFMNSKFVNLYCGGLGPDQLYTLYYGCDPPKRESELSPWEEELQKILGAN